MQLIVLEVFLLKCNDHSIGKWISIIYRYAQNYFSRELEPYNMGGGQFIFLLALYKEDGIHQECLSKLLNIDKGTTARAIKKLEEEGYVLRREDPMDRRAYKVFITNKAQAIKPEFYKILASWTDILSKDFTVEEKELAISLLQRMAENAADFVRINHEK